MSREDHRASRIERGYGKVWQKIREMKLNANPICERCDELAEVVHHKDFNQYNNLEDNLESLCRIHHEAIHGRLTDVSCDVDGYPLSENHPWSKK
jgi:5-methylcytosine-specific restriction endonuclease McrA